MTDGACGWPAVYAGVCWRQLAAWAGLGTIFVPRYPSLGTARSARGSLRVRNMPGPCRGSVSHSRPEAIRGAAYSRPGARMAALYCWNL